MPNRLASRCDMMPAQEGIKATNAKAVEMKNTRPGFHFNTVAINVEIMMIETIIQNVSCTGSTIGQSILVAILRNGFIRRANSERHRCK